MATSPSVLFADQRRPFATRPRIGALIVKASRINEVCCYDAVGYGNIVFA